MKARADSKLYGLKPEQRTRLDEWLFRKNLSYKKVVELCKQEFGILPRRNSLGRYYANEKPNWRLAELARKHAENGAEKGDADGQYVALLVTIESMALDMARGSKDELKTRELADLVHLLIAARRLVNESQRVAIARDKLEFDAATECLLHNLEIERVTKDESLSEVEQIRAVRERLFGPNLPE